MNLATKIVGYESKDEGMFISFENASHIHRLRIFMNSTANDRPVYFFLRIPLAGVIAYDMLKGNRVSLHEKAAGTRHEKELTYRELFVDTQANEYVLTIGNFQGVAQGGMIVRKPDDTGIVNVIHIPKVMAREIGFAILAVSPNMS